MADSEEQSDAALYQPTMDLSRFRQLIQEAEHERLVSCDPPRVKHVTKSNAPNVKHNGTFLAAEIIILLIV